LKFARLTLMATLMMLPVVAAAQLGPSQNIVTAVPFQFMVDHRAVPAGTYVVKPAYLWNSSMLVIENEKAKVHVSFFVSYEKSQTGLGSSLIFHKYGDRYFLSGIRLNGSTIERLSESKQESELRTQSIAALENASTAALK
jgi:hypothetical protein